MAGPIAPGLPLRGMAATEQLHSRRDLAVPHTATQDHDTDDGVVRSIGMEKRIHEHAQRENKAQQGVCPPDAPAETETRLFLVL